MIEFRNVSKAYKEKQVLRQINLTIQSDEFLVLIGSSGCGKTTLLKIINKLHPVTEGEVRIDGASISQIDETDLRRRIGYVVQDGGLFPHLTVAQSVGQILRVTGVPEKEREKRVDDLLRMVDLDPAVYRDLYPSQLSGGQKQRVGVARAFFTDPSIILMDEPFSALDPVTRSELQDEVYRLQKKYHKTVVFVTHDMDEAIKLADRICIIEAGQIVQCDTPEQILKHPADAYVTEFVGKNRLWGSPEFIKAKDLMKRRPYTVSHERTIIQALQVMNHNSVDSVLVTDRGRLTGIIWLKDLSRHTNLGAPLEEYISHDYTAVFEDDSLKKIVNTIDYGRAGILPVVDHAGNLVGFLTKSILLAALSKQYEEPKGEQSMLEQLPHAAAEAPPEVPTGLEDNGRGEVLV